MLHIYSHIVETVAMLRPILERIEKHDRDLARQLRRCLASVLLNTSEGSGSQGKNRKARYFNALGSQRETRACLDVAATLGYIPPIDKPLHDKLDHVSAVLWKLAH